MLLLELPQFQDAVLHTGSVQSVHNAAVQILPQETSKIKLKIFLIINIIFS
jgi:hypothetical protein